MGWLEWRYAGVILSLQSSVRLSEIQRPVLHPIISCTTNSCVAEQGNLPEGTKNKLRFLAWLMWIRSSR